MDKNTDKYFDAYLKQFIYSTPNEKNFIRKYLSIEKLEKGDFILKSGEVQTQIGFLYEGLVRRFFIDEQGNEITTGFTKENEYVTDYPSFIRQISTKYYFQCLEPTIMVNLSYEVIQECYKKFKNSEMQGRLVAETVLTILSDRVESFLFNTAEERYLKFVKEHPDLMQRVSLTHLASFLGIKRQSLSRIRNKLSK
ncbi:Crp/Fnr family transcriptional regulator [Bernardetia sp.]|uniref:Crp/Fnr family transcriptional regulator n=1 Tax=Bernardetia sp. TaxID=1937974 RepID=UPI0025C2B12E|nr:Crp/Fnr family transcriptional regulator [Bernardetia sp.]